MASVTHKPKSGALLTGTEYEASDAHTVALVDADIPATIARDTEVTTAVSDHSAAADPHTGYRLESADHSHATTGLQGGTVSHAVLTSVTATDHHAAPAAGPDANVTVDAAGAAGTASTFARSGHGHQVVTDTGVASTQAFGDAATAGTSGTIQRGGHKHAMPANPVAYAAPSLTLGTANATGAAATLIRSDATILAFDATVPAAVGTAAAGAATVTARRDHVHPTGAGTPSTQAFADAATTGSGPAAAMTDHKHAMPTLGYGHTGNSAPAVSLTTASAFATATTSVSAATYADVTGVTVTLAAGTWLVIGQCTGSSVNAQAIMHVAITDASNVVLSEQSQAIPASGTASVAQLGHCSVQAIVVATGAAIKMRAARGLTTITGTWVAMNGAGTNTLNNLTDGSNKGTGIFAVRIA